MEEEQRESGVTRDVGGEEQGTCTTPGLPQDSKQAGHKVFRLLWRSGIEGTSTADMRRVFLGVPEIEEGRG